VVNPAGDLPILSIFHYLMGGLFFVLSLVPLAMVPFTRSGQGAYAVPILVGIGLVTLVDWAIAAATAYAGLCPRRRRHRPFCLVVACLLCLSVPLGTVLGIFTILVLLDTEAKAAFGVAEPSEV